MTKSEESALNAGSDAVGEDATDLDGVLTAAEPGSNEPDAAQQEPEPFVPPTPKPRAKRRSSRAKGAAKPAAVAPETEAEPTSSVDADASIAGKPEADAVTAFDTAAETALAESELSDGDQAIRAEEVSADDLAADLVAGESETPAEAQAAQDAAAAAVEAKAAARPGRKPAAKRPARSRKGRAARSTTVRETVVEVHGLTKRFGDVTAVDNIDLIVPVGSFFGLVGPNGAGKTTTMSMLTGLLRPDEGHVIVHEHDVWEDADAAKREMGILPDRLRLFDRLTGRQLLHYNGVLRGLDRSRIRERSNELIAALGLGEAADRIVADYSAGMTKKISLACALLHAPRLLVLDEPFEAVDPVSTVQLIGILKQYVAGGGTVILSSHTMDLVQRECDRVAVIVEGKVLASGTMDEVRAGKTLEQRFVELAGSVDAAEGMSWLHSFSD